RTGPPEFIDSKQFIQLDITNQELTYKLISKTNSELVIHLVAISDVDFCERNPELAFQVNCLGARNVAIACQRFDTALCYVSTDYVFDGKNTPQAGYRETDTPNPVNVYGKTKYLGEKYVEHLLNKFYIVRTAWLFGSYRKNFVNYVIDAVKSKKEINVCIDQCGSPTYTHHLSIAISKLIEKPLYGIYHITNSGGGNRIEIVEEIFKLLKKSTKIVKKTRKELYFAERPRDSRLDNYIWQLDGFEKLPTYQEALKEYICRYS
ncbi:MAG: dTDP-4-dehydrorhamnose reductase, partial [Elusimicrobiota bacterium]|nr:dTDP-4-dehydrorhamnose reductase [Elusimicrobiota bacterium]